MMEMYLSICFNCMIWSDHEICWGGIDIGTSEDGDVVVNLGPVALRNALADPDDVATLLLLQLEEGVEDSKVELLHESILVQPHLNHLVSDLGKQSNNTDLLLEEFILQGFLPRVSACSLKALLVLAVVFRHLPHLQTKSFSILVVKCLAK